MESRLPSGSEVLDKLLEGGFEHDVITTIYGPSGSGKTCFCLQAALAVAKEKKVFFIDTEGGFSPDRALQLSNDNKKTWENVVVFSPATFDELHNMISQLSKMVNERVGLVIIDSIAMLYRLEMHKADDTRLVNRQLALQLAMLSDIVRKHSIPVLLTSQVYANFNDGGVRMTGGDFLKYSCKCLMELQKNGAQRKVILHKHRSLPAKEILFEIKKQGTININATDSSQTANQGHF